MRFVLLEVIVLPGLTPPTVHNWQSEQSQDIFLVMFWSQNQWQLLRLLRERRIAPVELSF